MCLVVKGKRPRIRIATRNIKCYKILIAENGNYRSLHYNGDYNEKNKIYVAKNLYGEEIKTIKIQKDAWSSRIAYEVYEGIHSYKYEPDNGKKNTSKYIANGKKIKIVKFQIPKGAKYIYSPFKKEYVSTKVIRIS